MMPAVEMTRIWLSYVCLYLLALVSTSLCTSHELVGKDLKTDGSTHSLLEAESKGAGVPVSFKTAFRSPEAKKTVEQDGVRKKRSPYYEHYEPALYRTAPAPNQSPVNPNVNNNNAIQAEISNAAKEIFRTFGQRLIASNLMSVIGSWRKKRPSYLDKPLREAMYDPDFDEDEYMNHREQQMLQHAQNPLAPPPWLENRDPSARHDERPTRPNHRPQRPHRHHSSHRPNRVKPKSTVTKRVNPDGSVTTITKKVNPDGSYSTTSQTSSSHVHSSHSEYSSETDDDDGGFEYIRNADGSIRVVKS